MPLERPSVSKHREMRIQQVNMKVGTQNAAAGSGLLGAKTYAVEPSAE